MYGKVFSILPGMCIGVFFFLEIRFLQSDLASQKTAETSRSNKRINPNFKRRK